MKIRFQDCLKVAGSVFLLYLCIHYWGKAADIAAALLGAAVPLIIGCAVAYLVNILMTAYEKQYFPNTKHAILASSRRPVCMVLAFLTLVAIVLLVCWLIIPQLIECVAVIVAEFPGFMDKAVDFAAQIGLFSDDIMGYLESIDWQAQISKVVSFVTSGLGDVVSVVVSAVSSVFSWLVTALLSVIFAIYLLASKEKLANQGNRLMKRYLPEKVCDRIMYFLDVLNHCFHRYIVGQCTEAVILGMLCAAGMAILRLPYAMMIGALVAFTALIPVAGAYIGACVGAFMILTVDPWQALVFLVFLVVLQQLEGNLVYPRVVGSSMGLPGIWVLAAVTVGGGVAGVGGMLLGVPLAATAYRVIKDDVHKYEIPAEQEDSEN